MCNCKEIIGFVEEGRGAKKRLKAYFKDDAGVIELVWFNGASYILRSLKVNTPYTILESPISLAIPLAYRILRWSLQRGH